jgi:hypothetical protein
MNPHLRDAERTLDEYGRERIKPRPDISEELRGGTEEDWYLVRTLLEAQVHATLAVANALERKQRGPAATGTGELLPRDAA